MAHIHLAYCEIWWLCFFLLVRTDLSFHRKPVSIGHFKLDELPSPDGVLEPYHDSGVYEVSTLSVAAEFL